MDLEDRIAWAVSRIKEDTKLSWPNLAEKLGTTKDTVAHYARKTGGHIKSIVLERIVVEFGYSAIWLLEGKGEPYLGARAEHPEVCGEETPYIKEAIAPTAKAKPDPEPEPLNLGSQFVEDINHLKVIYDYGDLEIINAIHSNLKTFNRTVVREIEAEKLKQKVLRLDEENAEQKSRIDKLEKAVEKLMSGQMAVQEKRNTVTNA